MGQIADTALRQCVLCEFRSPAHPQRGRDSERVGGKLKKGSKNRCHGTVTEVLPEMLPSVAVIVAVPFLLAFAKPFDPPALLILTTARVDETPTTEVVKFWVLESL